MAIKIRCCAVQWNLFAPLSWEEASRGERNVKNKMSFKISMTLEVDKTVKSHKYFNTQLRAMIYVSEAFLFALLSCWLLFLQTCFLWSVILLQETKRLCIFNFMTFFSLIIKSYEVWRRQAGRPRIKESERLLKTDYFDVLTYRVTRVTEAQNNHANALLKIIHFAFG